MKETATPMIAIRDTKVTAKKAVVAESPEVLEVARRTRAVRPIEANMINSTAILITCIRSEEKDGYINLTPGVFS